MKRGALHTPVALIIGLAIAGPLPAPVFLWTGIENGWKAQTPPPYPGDGSAIVEVGDALRQTIPFTGNIDLSQLVFTEDDGFRLTSTAGPITLTLRNGIDTSADQFVRVDFSSDLTVSLPQNQTWQLGEGGGATLHGPLSGAGNLTVDGYTGALVLANLTGTPSSHSGAITMQLSSAAPLNSGLTLAVWGANSLGTGPITFTNGGILSVHQAPTLTNNLVLNNGPLLPGQVNHHAVRIRSWDSPATTLSGSVTLANNTTLGSLTGFENRFSVQFPNSTGAFPQPGSITRYPVIFSGPIGEAGGSRTLNVVGQGVLIFSGSNTYTGGTKVGFAGTAGSATEVNQGGSLIFANSGAIPATGLIQSGLTNTNAASGYVGFAATAFTTPGSLQTVLNTKLVPGSSGAVGVDTLPGESTQTFSDAINLTNFNTTATGGIRLGTATSAILTGTITPQLTTHYNFGNGGGRLYVQSNLINLTTATQVLTNSTGAALELYLQGTNSYSGGTVANTGFLVFDGAGAIPASGQLTAGASSTSVGSGYLGHTQATGLAPAAFLAKFNQANTWGVIGFDTNTPGTPHVVSNLDLTGFNDGVFIGTKSEATLTGTIGLTTVANPNNAANTLRVTAATGGKLDIQSVLADGAQPLSVLVGPAGSFQKMADGRVLFSGANTYSGGTNVSGFGGITLVANSSAAFGTGALTLQPQGGMIGLEAGAPGVTLGNNIIFATPTSGGTPILHLGGTQDFTLGGDISGPAAPGSFGLGQVSLAQPITVSLTGANGAFDGAFSLFDGTLHFATDTAAGGGSLFFNGPGGTAKFTSSTPVLHGLSGDLGGTIRIGDTTTLIISRDDPAADYSFAGTITGLTGPSAGSLVVTGAALDADFVYLSGSNQYSGGTSITGTGALALGHDSAAGSGPITINATNGGLALNSNVTLTNPIILTQGGLAGLGTFAPTSFNGTPGAPVVIGANQVIIPGVPDDFATPGKLTISGNLSFATGGSFQWLMQDPSDPEGYSLLYISGNLDLTTVAPGTLTLELTSIDSTGLSGSPSDGIVFGQSYTVPIMETGGSILGFDPAKFSFDTTSFQGGEIPSSFFSVTADTNRLYLNFTAVPEPSTWALLILGAGFVGVTAWRRRRA